MVLPRGAQTAATGEETTVVGPAGAQAPAQQASAFVLDLDSFSRNFEADEQARVQAEETARRKKADELHRWAEEQARKREEFERQRESDAQKTSTGGASGSRRGALDLLKQKAATRSPEDHPAVKKAKADAALDQSMRAALRYLAEVARELNGVNPTTERPYDYFCLGRLPSVRLSNAFVDLRTSKIEGKDHGHHLFFRFRAQPVTPAKSTLLGADIARFHEYLKMLNIPFESTVETKSDFGQATRETFTVSAPLPCEVNIRVDYDHATVEFELVNVRRPGRVRCRIEPNMLDDVVDDLARYLLGIDDDFDKVLNRR